MECSPQQITRRVEDPVKSSRRILVIDDDACIGAAIQAILCCRQCQTIVLAARSIAGIQALQQSPFDVVMLDIFMPGLSGLDALDYIRRDSSIPIIAMSGFRLQNSADRVDYLAMAAQRGATLCMRKPFTAAELIKAVDWTYSLQCPNEGPPN
jgi:CheY-like chemotaxis protein